MKFATLAMVHWVEALPVRVPALVFTTALLASVSLLAEPNFKVTWPDSMEATVKEHITRQGTTMELAYTLVVTRNPAEKTYTWVHKDAHVISVNGQKPPPGDEKSLMMQSLVVMAGKTLTLVVNKNGELVSIPNQSEMVDAFEEMMKHAPFADENSRGRALKMVQELRSDFGRRALSALAGLEWQAWVGEWLFFEAPENGSREKTLRRPFLDGQLFDCKIKSTHLGAAPQNTKLVEVKMEETLDDPRITEAIKDMLMKHDKEVGRQQSFDAVGPMSVRTTYKAFLDPKALLPYWVKMEKDTQVTSTSGKPPTRGTEIREYEFIWKEQK